MASEPLDQPDTRDAAAFDGVLIAGGGVGGLATALGAVEAGHRVHRARAALGFRRRRRRHPVWPQRDPHSRTARRRAVPSRSRRSARRAPRARRGQREPACHVPAWRLDDQPAWIALLGRVPPRRSLGRCFGCRARALITIKMGFGVGVWKDKGKRVLRKAPTANS